MRELVTGAAGLLGGHLVDLLVERGRAVRAMVLPTEDATRLQRLPDVEIVRGDVTCSASLRRAVQGVCRVYHLAAKTGVWGTESSYWRVNVWGSGALVRAAQEAGVQRIVHVSSITVYGHRLRGIVSEDHPFHAEPNPYSRSKIAAEQLLAGLIREQGAPVIIVRPGWIYGPRDRASFARFVSRIAAGRGFLVGSGRNILPLVYVRDVARGLLRAAQASDACIGQAYTLADDQRVSQAEYMQTIAACLGVAPVTRTLPFWPLYLAGRCAEVGWRLPGQRAGLPPLTTYGVTLLGGHQEFSIEKARRDLGYAPAYTLMQGVAQGVRWYQLESGAGSGATSAGETPG
ncbi:MAG TPA: NAD-dependent epimerase/dehydratase family protein [Ktedonobacteraceae bacterium]|jgi:nucleoside-diphosphate-sugar epimerase